MPEEAQNLLIADSSVLINFLSIRRLELLTGLPYQLLITTRDIMVLNIKRGALTIEQADAIKQEWATQYRFVLKIASFRLLIE